MDDTVGTHDRAELPERMSDGKLPAFAWPGGYPILYLLSDGESLCPKCVNEEECVHFGGPEDIEPADDGWRVVGYRLHYEGPPNLCANCNAETASAYGDPNAGGGK